MLRNVWLWIIWPAPFLRLCVRNSWFKPVNGHIHAYVYIERVCEQKYKMFSILNSLYDRWCSLQMQCINILSQYPRIYTTDITHLSKESYYLYMRVACNRSTWAVDPQLSITGALICVAEGLFSTWHATNLCFAEPFKRIEREWK